jgi:hypothetical protein
MAQPMPMATRKSVSGLAADSFQQRTQRTQGTQNMKSFPFILVPKRTAVRRAFTRDHLTFDNQMLMPIDSMGNVRGKALDHAYRTHDGARTVDSTGAFLVGELERLDQELHMPLAAVSWSRDIDLREDVSLADEMTSFTLSTFAAAGNLGNGNGIRNGKAWIGKSTDQIGGISMDMGKIASPLRLWGMELKYSIPELESAAKLGRPIDDQKYEGLKLKNQMDIDEQVYVGDATTGDTGLVNFALVTNVSNLPNGASASPRWATKTPDEILRDVNAQIQSTWQASGWAVMSNRLLLPPAVYGDISTRVISTAGNTSILKYLLENNVLKASGQGTLEIQPAKWLIGAGVGGVLGVTGGVDRMVLYRKEKQYLRYPMTLLQRTPVQYQSIYHLTTYYCRLGRVEVVYPETMSYRDGL